MVVQNPCCMNLRAGAHVVAIVNIGLSGISLCVMGIIFYVSWITFGFNLTDNHRVYYGSFVAHISIIIFMTVGIAINFVASIELYIGVSRSDILKCKRWIFAQLGWLLFAIIDYIIIMMCMEFPTETRRGYGILVQLVVSFLGIMLILYQIWIIYAFMEQLKREKGICGTVVSINTDQKECSP